MNLEKRTEIFRRWREANPHPKSDLEYSSTFELLVSVILSAQATDKGVNAATRKLYPVANTPQAIYDLGEEQLGKYIQTIGLWKAKAKNVIATCRALLDKHGGQVPGTREELEALPGVGRKTANVVLNIAFGEHTIAVDTHNFRVANRTGIAPGKTVEAVEKALMKFVPAEFLQHAHHWLILHGRYTCKALKPDCPNCIISDLCEYKHKTPDPLAEPPAKKVKDAREFAVRTEKQAESAVRRFREHAPKAVAKPKRRVVKAAAAAPAAKPPAKKATAKSSGAQSSARKVPAKGAAKGKGRKA
jgi:endonuclease-3